MWVFDMNVSRLNPVFAHQSTSAPSEGTWPIIIRVALV